MFTSSTWTEQKLSCRRHKNQTAAGGESDLNKNRTKDTKTIQFYNVVTHFTGMYDIIVSVLCWEEAKALREANQPVPLGECHHNMKASHPEAAKATRIQ